MSAAPYEAAGTYEYDVDEPFVSTNGNPRIAEMQDETAAAFAQYRRTGEDADLHEFLTRAAPLVRGYCGNRFSDPSDADNATQETLLTLLTLAKETEVPDRAIISLIYRVAGFDVIDGHRTRTRALQELTLAPRDDEGGDFELDRLAAIADPGPSPDVVVTGTEELEGISELLGTLPPAEAAALRAKILGVPAIVAAQDEYTSPAAMRAALWRARNRTGGPDRPRLTRNAGTRTHPDTLDPPIPAGQIPLALTLLDQLSPRQRQVVELALQGMPPRKIAEVTGIGIGPITQHKKRGFDQLRSLLTAFETTDGRESDAESESLRREAIATFIAFRFSWIERPEAMDAIANAAMDHTAFVEEHRRSGFQLRYFRDYVRTAVEGAPILQAVSAGLERLPHPQVQDEKARIVYAAVIARALSSGDAASRLGIHVKTARATANKLQAALDPPVIIPEHIRAPTLQRIGDRKVYR